MTTSQVSLRSGRGSIVLLTLILSWTVGAPPAPARGQDPPPTPVPVQDGADPQGAAAPAPDQADPEGPQVLTRGPVHEAFAAPVVHDTKGAPVIPKEPPAPIQEMPPDQKPAGQNIQWIPGYWSWDVSRGDYLWLSGIWREPPPNNQWVPGYWHQVQDGFQWVPGTWIPVSTGQGSSQPSYLPQPPQSLEAGPNTPQPSANVSWTPGYWSWQGANYAWRPGFWAAVQPNWIWIPAHYVWTPSGHLFVPGYWDLPVANRGLLFAPVYYPSPVYAQPSFVFTPSISIVGSAVTANLFVQPATNQYLFGDFYARNFVSVGITPWFSFSFATGRPAYYDPLFSYYAVINVQQNPRWVTQIRETYVLRRDNVAMRPPHTFVEQTRLIERNVNITRNVTVVDHRTMAMPLSKLASDPVAGKGLRMVRVNEAERQQLHQQVAQLHQFREQRAQQEREGARARAAGGAAAARPRPMNLPHSPIASRPAPHPAGSHADVAQRSENERQASRDSSLGREAHPAANAAKPHQAGSERAASGAESASHRFGQNAGGSRPQSRPATSRPAGREPARSTSSNRGRSRSTEEEERRRPNP